MKDPRPMEPDGRFVYLMRDFDFRTDEAYHKALHEYVDFLKTLCIGAGLTLEPGSSFEDIAKEVKRKAK